MLSTAAVLFAIAAVGGVVLASLHLRGRPRPWLLTIVHGLVAATALVVLILVAFNAGTSGLLTASLLGFVVAALGGFVLLSFRLRNKPLPTAGVVGHGLLAVVAFVLLLLVLL